MLTHEQKTMTLPEWRAEARRRFGPDPTKWKFICPVCGFVASTQDWKDAGATSGAVAFSCIGRYRGAKSFMDKGKGPCDYTGGGLIRLNPVTVVREKEGDNIEAFAFAPSDLGVVT